MKRSELLKKAAVTDSLVAVFILTLDGSDRDLQEVADLLCDMAPAELKTLRVALARLDGMLDALALDRHLKRDSDS